MPERVEPKFGGLPRIEAIVEDGTIHHFTPRVLDLMLDRGLVKRFRRMSGWVTVGVDSIRHGGRNEGHLSYHGPERRTVMNTRQRWLY